MEEPEQAQWVQFPFHGLDNWGFIVSFLAGEEFSLLHCIMTNSEVHLTYCPQGIGSPKDKAPRE